MENMGELEKNLVINEIIQGRELARRLQMWSQMPSSSSQEAPELLIQGIIASFEKALAMVSSSGEPSSQPILRRICMSESPPLSASPRSEDSDRDFQDHNNASKKRKSMARWTKRIQVNPGMGVEGTLDDGFSWRKYGQKDILGARHPRGYYRCTHRNVQGCLATKQVQRSDEDPSVFEITYRGNHTCAQASNVVAPSGTPESQQHHELLSNLRAGLRVQTENLEGPEGPPPPQDHSFLFASSSTSTSSNNKVLTNPMMENCFAAANFCSDTSCYMSPATSAISVSPPSDTLCGQPSFASPAGSDMNNGMISAVTSAANSPTLDLDLISFDQLGFDPNNFTFDNPRLF